MKTALSLNDAGTTKEQESAPLMTYTELLFGGREQILFLRDEERLQEQGDAQAFASAMAGVKQILSQ